MKALKVLTVSMSIFRGQISWCFSLSKNNISPAAPDLELILFPQWYWPIMNTHTKQQQDKVFQTDFIDSQKSDPPPPFALAHNLPEALSYTILRYWQAILTRHTRTQSVWGTLIHHLLEMLTSNIQERHTHHLHAAHSYIILRCQQAIFMRRAHASFMRHTHTQSFWDTDKPYSWDALTRHLYETYTAVITHTIFIRTPTKSVLRDTPALSSWDTKFMWDTPTPSSWHPWNLHEGHSHTIFMRGIPTPSS